MIFVIYEYVGLFQFEVIFSEIKYDSPLSYVEDVCSIFRFEVLSIIGAFLLRANAA